MFFFIPLLCFSLKCIAPNHHHHRNRRSESNYEMLISESESVGCGKPQQQQQPQVGGGEEDQDQDPSLGRQNSVFTLTLDEIQCKSGKNFGSMNMDEFLASVWSVEDDPNPNNKTQNTSGSTTTALARQGSLTVPVSLCNKTVDEVWFEIHHHHAPLEQNNKTDSNIPRQQTLGEITLEDFLIKAGVVQEPVSATSLKKLQVAPPVQLQEQHHHACDASPGIVHGFVAGMAPPPGNGFMGYQMFTKSGSFAGESSNGDDPRYQGGAVDPGGPKGSRKRIIDGPPEVVVERRQRRMIKNRESAARSRARRQAYTVELELELNQLREENTKLKQILEDMEQKRKEEVMKRKKSKDHSKLMRTIRRTVSLGW